MHDNYDWNEDRALQKALEVSLEEEKIRSRQEGESLPQRSAAIKSSNSTKKDFVSKNFNDFFGSKENNRFTNDIDSIETSSTSNEQRRRKNSFDVHSIVDSSPLNIDYSNEIRESSERFCSIKQTTNLSDRINKLKADKHSNLSENSSNSDQNANNGDDKSIRYLENDAIRKTISAQRKFASKTSYSIRNRFDWDTIPDDDSMIDNRNSEFDSDTEPIEFDKDFEIFPNQQINFSDFITWVCHTDIEDIKNMAYVQFPKIYSKSRDADRMPNKISKHQEIEDDRDQRTSEFDNSNSKSD